MNKNIILAVDDQPNNLKVIAGVLGDEYQLSIANNGHNALKILDKLVPDLILLDIMMPGMDGFEVCHEIKLRPQLKDIPIIFLTAKTEISDIVKAFEAGAVDYIFKPFNPLEVKARVYSQLQLFHTSRQLKELNYKLAVSQQELELTNVKLETLNKQKDKFFSVIAHDLKTPFNNVMALTSLISESLASDEKESLQEYVSMLSNTTGKAMDLLMNLLEWAKSQTGNLKFTPRLIQPFIVIQDVLSIHQESVRAKSLIVKFDCNPDYEFFGDQPMIATVLRNLVGNAIKFSLAGGVIYLKVNRLADGSTQFSVKDFGIGIGSDLLPLLFVLGANTGRPGTRGEPSSGLGLMLCKDFVERHGGGITVESAEGKGSEFSFTIPDLSDSVNR
jgi:signal transduction histidine kinase